MLYLIYTLSLFFLISCQAPQTKQPGSNQSAQITLPKEEISQSSDDTIIKESDDAENTDLYSLSEIVRSQEPDTTTNYDNSRFDFPITMNSKVEGWIDYFTGRGRKHYEKYLARSHRYIPIIKSVLKREGLPEDLVYLAMIESGFNLKARSRARAVGPWQFIAGTGKRYGLKITPWIDERRDIEKSTVAAANYLKDLYLMFESWYLAAAAYNAGENKVLRAIKALNTKNFWNIAKTRYFRRETKDYVPKLIAAAILAKNTDTYGFSEVNYHDPLKFETTSIEYPIYLKDMAKLIDASEKELANLNPELTTGIIPPELIPYQMKLPTGSKNLVTRALVAKKTQLAKSVLPIEYRVRRGDNLYAIAKKFRVSIHEIAQINHLRRLNRIHPGKKLVIPSYSHGRKTIANYRPKSRKITSSKNKLKYHRVRKGESLWSISEKHNVTVKQLFQWNPQLNYKKTIYPKMKLKVYPR